MQRMARWLLVVVAATAPLTATALEVVVVRPDGGPLAGAHVTVIGRRGVTVTDGDGRCRIEPTPQPPFVLFVARADGVALSPVTVVELPADGPLEVVVTPVGGSISVVAGGVPDLVLPPASAATVVGRGDLDQRQPASVAEVLETVPGANVGGEGQSAVPGLRGLPKFRTLLLLDDGRVATERRAGPSASYLDPDTVDEIEVVRGPGSVAYGSDAFGGIIRARSRGPEEGTGGRYHLYGTEGTDGWGAAADVWTGLAGGGLLLGAQYRDFDDYSSPEGEVFNSGHREQGLRAAWNGRLAGGTLRVGWRTDQSRDVGKPAPDSDVSRDLYPEEDSHRLNLAWERPGPGAWDRLATSVAWDDYQLVLNRDALDGDRRPASRDQSDVSSSGYTVRLEGERQLQGARLVTGLDVHGRYGLEAVNRFFERSASALELTATEVSIESARTTDWGAFAGLSRDWDRWGVSAGLRWDLVETVNAGGFFGDTETSDDDVSGFVAGRYSVGPAVELVGQVARGFRAPRLSDRYYRGITGRGTITGNPDLVPETSLQYDLGLRVTTARVTLAAYGYLYRIDDLIERFRDPTGDFRFRNRSSAEIRGLELEVAVELGGDLFLDSGVTWARGEIRADGSATDDVPAPGAFVRLRSDGEGPLLWTIRGSVFARDDRPGPNEQVVPGYAVVDGSVAWVFNDGLRLRLVGRNLLDRSYLGSADEDAVLAPGRTVILGLRGAW